VTTSAFSTSEPTGVSDNWLARIAVRVILTLLWAGASVAASWQTLGLGLDYRQYANFYWNLAANWATPEARFEPGIKLWAMISQNGLNLSFEWFMWTFIATALGIKFALLASRTAIPPLAALVYMCVFYPVLEYTQIRAGMGIALVFIGVFDYLDGRWKRSLVFFTCAIAFHYSMAAPAIVVLGSAIVRTRVRLLLVIVLVGFLALALGNIIDGAVEVLNQVNPLTARYVYNLEQTEGANILSVWNIAILFVAMFGVAFGLYEEDRTNQVLILMSIAAFTSIVVFRNSVELALRLREVFSLSTVFFAFRQPAVPWRWIPASILLIAGAYVFLFNNVGQTILF